MRRPGRFVRRNQPIAAITRPGALNKARLFALVIASAAATGAWAQSGGFTVAPLDPVDPADPADPDQGASDAGIGSDLGLGVAINPDMGLVETPIPNLDMGLVDVEPDPDTGFMQVNPDVLPDDGVALFQTRNMAAQSSITSVTAAAGNRAQLRALDRTVGQRSDFEIGVGETVSLGRLLVRLEDCRYPVDNPASDAFAHLRIADQSGRVLFDGWMIASSPALTALEHPRYDVWVLSCNTS